MAGNHSFLKSEASLAWLGQFKAVDQPIAESLLRAMVLVSRDMFVERLRSVVLQSVAQKSGPVGLYAEREVPHRKGVPFKLFKETGGKVKRAYGVGPLPVHPTKAYDVNVGSEGLVSHIVSELCREHPDKIFNHPGPDQIRKHAIRRFILVTDYIGSGKRARAYIQAAWRVRSVRSWWSARATKGMAFEVIAYAASKAGRAHVERHPSQPIVQVATMCPTIDTAFTAKSRSEVRSLCARYAPVKKKESSPFGFGSVGALIAFAHGVPNNAPQILHKKSKSWLPLFPLRITASSRAHFGVDVNNTETLRENLVAMRQTKLANAGWITTAKPYARNTLMVMAALSLRPRDAEAVSARTQLALIEVEHALRHALANKWIDGRNRLTDEGHGQLAHVRKAGFAPAALSSEPEELYYPTSLRAPSGRSS